MLPQQLNNLPQLGRLLEEAETVIYERADYQLQWLQTIGDCLLNTYGLEDFTIMTQNRILYTVYKIWSGCSRDATYKWDYEFLTWAKRFTKRRGKEPADETIANKISVYRDWKAECIIALPETVSIPERDEAGRPTGNIIKIAPNIDEWDYSKLLQARAMAKEGNLSEEAWSALADPYQTVNQLQRAMGKTKDKDPSDLKFFERDGIIVAEKFGHFVDVAMPLFENIKDPLFKEAISHVLGVLGIPIPADLK